MRLLAALALALSLAGCSSMPLDELQRVQLNTEAEAYPTDYKVIVRQTIGVNRSADLLVSEPREMVGDKVVDRLRWYTCVRGKDGSEMAIVLSGNKDVGRIAGPVPYLCDGIGYSALDGAS